MPEECHSLDYALSGIPWYLSVLIYFGILIVMIKGPFCVHQKQSRYHRVDWGVPVSLPYISPSLDGQGLPAWRLHSFWVLCLDQLHQHFPNLHFITSGSVSLRLDARHRLY